MRFRVAFAACALVVGAPLTAAADPAPSLPQANAADPLPEAPAPRVGDGISDAELADLTSIAADRGMSVDEAIASFGWQNNYSLAMDQIRDVAPEAFAAAEIVDAGHAWVSFVGAVPAAAAAPIAEFRAAFPTVAVEVRSGAVVSEIDLDVAMAAAHFAVFEDADVRDATTVFDPDTATLVTRVVTDSPTGEARMPELRSSAAARVLDAVGPDVGAALKVSVLHSDQPVLTGQDAGASVHEGGEIISGCTSGFGTRASSSTSGTRGISTAGHCSDSQSDDGYALTYKGGYEGTYGDFQWHTGPMTLNDNFFSGSSTATEVNSRDTTGTGNATLGQTVCQNGATTHYHCQQVRKTSVCAGGECNLVQLGSRDADGGDSGGPVFVDRTAYGLHKGWMYDPAWPTDRDLYSKSTRIDDALGIYIATN